MTLKYTEDDISQVPALQLLINLGYQYLSPAEALKERGGKNSNVLLESILVNQLKKINKISFRGESHNFSDGNIQNAVAALRDMPFDGLVRTNEKIYDLLTLGKSLEETIDGNTKSYNLNFIDWDEPKNNIFHVTEGFEVSKTASYETRRPDIVLFVNGIPFAVIECKRPDLENIDPIDQAISQHNRNQKSNEIPALFVFSQYLFAVSKNDGMYATTGTEERKFWSKWKNLKNLDAEIEKIINKPIKDEDKEKIFSQPFRKPGSKKYFDELEKSGERLVTEQDRLLFALLRKEELLRNTFKNVVFDAGIKKVARYQQHYAVKNILERVKRIGADGRRKGGVVFHTQGSGKSLTMVLLAKALVLDPEIPNPRVVLVTDRKDLDRQLRDNFKNCGLEPLQAKTGAHLVDIIEQGKAGIITAVINKFEAGLKRRSFKDEANNIFVLVDEVHRTQYGSLNVQMQRIFPNATYLGFTGTPLLSKDKNTAIKFGGIIDPAYTIHQAVEDKAVVELLYEGRHSIQEINKEAIDQWFERITELLTPEQKADLKKKFARSEKINETEQRIRIIAYDLSDHFNRKFKDTGLKGQLVAGSKKAALQYKQYLDEAGLVTSEVVISGPDTREGHENIYDEPDDEVQRFWKKMMEKWGDDERYNEGVINLFQNSDDPEIIIVVDKLLTGFDAPRNTVLYLTRNLKDHTLLQAIARVNRLYPGKEYGYILDYYGVLGNLDQALTDYGALADFDADDLKGALTNISEEVEKLPQRHSDLWDIFKTISNKSDNEAFEQLLGDEALRHRFYERLSSYARTLDIALANLDFVTKTPEKEVSKYKADLKSFMNLRSSVQRRYSETIDFKEYEKKIDKVYHTYVTSHQIEEITPQVNIFDKDNFQAEVAKVVGEGAQADTIASRTMKTITEKMQEDPAFYTKFSNMLQSVIDEWRQRRITEAQYLRRAKEILEAVQNRTDQDIPEKLKDYDSAKAFYGIVAETAPSYGSKNFDEKEIYADISLRINEIVERKGSIVDWVQKQDVQNEILNEIENCLIEFKNKYGIEFNWEQIDRIMQESLEVAKYRAMH
jgi:type I restriction enzyme, R subunit